MGRGGAAWPAFLAHLHLACTWHKSQNIAESILSLLCCALLRVRDRRGSCKSFGCRLLLGTPRCLPVLGFERVRVKIRCAMVTPTANAGHRKVLAIPYGAQFFASSSTLRELLLKPLLPLVLAAFSVALFLCCQKILSFHLSARHTIPPDSRIYFA